MYEEVGTMNQILRMNLITLKGKLRPFDNDGFNYKDRKVSRGGKIWVEENQQRKYDLNLEERKQFLKQQIRNGILSRDINLLKMLLIEAKKHKDISE
jgi:hypothetical protein